MKTLKDLVEMLNEVFPNQGNFCITYDDYFETLNLCLVRDSKQYDLVEISTKYHSWLLEGDIGYQISEVQHTIIDYLVNSNPKDWFDEKKYNIIIAHNYMLDAGHNVYMVWSKGEHGFFAGLAQEYELYEEEYLFTESEIDKLKSILSNNMAKIVDLGKVEVERD